MAESPDGKRKPYFPSREDLAGYNRQLAEDLGEITDPSTFGAFTLFPEADAQHHDSTSFVWQDLGNLSGSPKGNIYPPGVAELDTRPTCTFLPRYEDFVTNSQPPSNAATADPPSGGNIYSTVPHNGYSLHMPDDPDLSRVIGMGEASHQGFDIYSKALDDWNCFSSTYSPFGTKEVLNYATASDKGESSAKPSYSEVARSMKALNAQSAKTDAEYTKKKSECITKPGRPHIRKPFPKSYSIGKGRPGSGETPNITVPPDSKYGLDQFEDPAILKRGPSSLQEKTSSVESIPLLSRQESTSSVSSGASGIEEITISIKPPLINSSLPPTKVVVPPEVIGSRSTTEPLMGKGKGAKACPGPSTETCKTSAGSDYSKSSSGTSKSAPFFDPKRIFQSREYSSSNQSKKTGGGTSCLGSGSGTLLNNGKPGFASKSTAATHKPRTSDYIVNDLSDTKRKSSNHGAMGKDREPLEKNIKDDIGSSKFSGKHDKSKAGLHNRQSTKLKSQNIDESGAAGTDNSASTDGADPVSSSSGRGPNLDQELIDEWLNICQEKARWLCHHAWSLLVTIVILLITLVAFLVSSLAFLAARIIGKAWAFIHAKLFRHRWDTNVGFRADDSQRKIGLDENITLPTTGDEAMQRLLACKGKDPYSILGLRCEATDDEIKKYYKRQAVLVHPDKNQQPGAEEAFKILGHAFELIGEPDKRGLYDSQVHEVHEAETAMQEFADMLTKLQEKIQEAANMMRCDNCGGKHRRVPVKRPWYSARFCDRCSQRHSAKEGDVWAETSMLGFLWHYYAVMDGKVFDITEWVACRREFFKHMQANAHHVFYRIATEGNRGHNHGRSGENDLEEFINHLFHKAMSSEGSTDSSQWGSQKQSSQGSGATTGSTGWNGKDANSRRKKKKKKH